MFFLSHGIWWWGGCASGRLLRVVGGVGLGRLALFELLFKGLPGGILGGFYLAGLLVCQVGKAGGLNGVAENLQLEVVFMELLNLLAGDLAGDDQFFEKGQQRGVAVGTGTISL